MRMNQPVRHHFLPISYLQRFAVGGYVWLYDRKRQSFRRQKPIKTAAQRHRYSIEAADGGKSPVLEERLAVLEGDAKPLFDKMIDRKSLTWDEREVVSYFLAVLFHRTPRRDRELGECYSEFAKIMFTRNLGNSGVLKHLSEQAAASGRPPVDPARLLDHLNSGAVKAAPSRNLSNAIMCERVPSLAASFANADWVVAHADGNAAFVTCDSPIAILATNVSASKLRPYGVASPEVTKVVALSATTCLFFTGSQPRTSHLTLGEADVRHVNIAIVRETEEFAFGPDESELRGLVNDAGITDPAPLSRMVVDEIPHPSGDHTRSFLIVSRKRRNP